MTPEITQNLNAVPRSAVGGMQTKTLSVSVASFKPSTSSIPKPICSTFFNFDMKLSIETRIEIHTRHLTSKQDPRGKDQSEIVARWPDSVFDWEFGAQEPVDTVDPNKIAAHLYREQVVGDFIETVPVSHSKIASQNIDDVVEKAEISEQIEHRSCADQVVGFGAQLVAAVGGDDYLHIAKHSHQCQNGFPDCARQHLPKAQNIHIWRPTAIFHTVHTV